MKKVALFGIGFMFAAVFMPLAGVKVSMAASILASIGWVLAVVGVFSIKD